MSTAAPALARTGYETEMARLDEDVGQLNSGALAEPGNTEEITRHVGRLYQRAALSGDLTELQAVDPMIDQAIGLLPNPGDLYLLKANLAFKLHRLDVVESCLDKLPSSSLDAQVLRADLDWQHGRYQDARNRLEQALQTERRWDTLARIAHLSARLGDAEKADQWYAEAEDELTAKEMRSYAWLELQRGLLNFLHGRLALARAHYAHAETAYRGYWLTREYLAEVLGAEGRYEESALMYEQLVATLFKPEHAQALGELYALMGRSDRAQFWNDRASSAYLESAERGEVHYYHHMADFFSDVREDGAAAVKWAGKDLELRQNYSTQAALAWALYRDGQFAQARLWIDRALASGAIEAKLFYQAANIYLAFGQASDGARFMDRATKLNPCVTQFHLHH